MAKKKLVYENGGPIHNSLLSLLDATLDARPEAARDDADPQIAAVERSLSASGTLGSRVIIERAMRDMYRKLGLNSRDFVIVVIYEVDEKGKRHYHGTDLGFVSQDVDSRGEVLTVRDYLKRENLL